MKKIIAIALAGFITLTIEGTISSRFRSFFNAYPVKQVKKLMHAKDQNSTSPTFQALNQSNSTKPSIIERIKEAYNREKIKEINNFNAFVNLLKRLKLIPTYPTARPNPYTTPIKPYQWSNPAEPNNILFDPFLKPSH